MIAPNANFHIAKITEGISYSLKIMIVRLTFKIGYVAEDLHHQASTNVGMSLMDMISPMIDYNYRHTL